MSRLTYPFGGALIKMKNKKGQFIRVERIKIICLTCGKEEEILPCRYRRGRKYCSKKCMYEARKGLKLPEGHPFTIKGRIPWNKGEVVNKICKVCKKEFQVQSYRKETAKFCSRVCFENSGLSRERMKGNTYALGNKLSEKTRKQMSNTRKRLGTKPPSWKGKKHSEETKRKMSEWQKGENSPSWKGGISRPFHCGEIYRNWTKKVFERDNYICWICEDKGGELNGHHLKSWADYPELRYDVNNGVTLCKVCHKLYGYHKINKL